jgi:ribosomal-protein-alanine N-acetyltransferase
MEADDVAPVLAIEQECFGGLLGEAALRQELASRHALFLTAEQDGAVVGFAGAHVVDEDGHLVAVAVTAPRQGRGYARRLLRALLGGMVRRGVRRITLEVRESNEAALRLYRAFGFERVGRRRRYYADPEEDALVLWVPDTGDPAFQAALAKGGHQTDVADAAEEE